MATTQEVVEIILRAQNETAGAFASAARDMEGFGARAVSAGRMAASALGFAALGAMVAVTKSAADFQSTTQSLANNTNMGAAGLDAMRAAALNLSAATGQSTSAIAEGYMYIANHAYAGAAATNILAAATKNAAATNGDAAQNANMLVGILREYNVTSTALAASTGTATRFMDVLHNAVANSNFTMLDFVEGGKRAIATAGALGVPISQVSAQLAVLSEHGFPSASVAGLNWAGMLRALEAPTKTARENMASLGAATGVDLVGDIDKLRANGAFLPTFLADIAKATGGDFTRMISIMPRASYEAALAALVRNQGQLQAVQGVTGAAEAGTAAPGMVGTNEAFKAQQSTLLGQWGDLRASINVVAIQIGTAFLPVMTRMVQTIIPIVHAVGEWVTSHRQLASTIMAVTGPVGILLGGMLPLRLAFMGVAPIVGPLIGVIASLALPLVVVGAAAAALALAWRTNFQNIHGVVASGMAAAANVFHAFVSWLSGTAAPALYTVIGTIAGWWRDHGTQVVAALGYIWDRLKAWAGVLISGLRNAWNVLAADVGMLWDLVKGLWQAGGDAVRGDWGAVKDDLLNTTRTLGADMVRLFGLVVSNINDVTINVATFFLHMAIDLIPQLAGPLNGIIGAFNGFVQRFREPLGILAGLMAMAFTPLVDAAKLAMNGVMAAVQTVIDKIPTRIELPFGKHVDLPGITGFRHLVDSYKAQGIDSPGTAYHDAYNAVQQFSTSGGIGGGKPLDFKSIAKDLGVGVDQMAAVMKQYGVKGVQDMMSAIAGWVDPNSPEIKGANTAAMKRGKEIVNNIFGGFGNLFSGFGGGGGPPGAGGGAGTGGAGGGFTLPDTPPGTWSPGGMAAGGATGGAGQPSVTGRVALGNLGATFMSDLTSLASIGKGTDPATRAAQQNATLAQQSVNQGDKHTLLLQRIADGQTATVSRIEALLDAMTKAVVPTATPPDPMRRLAVARPRVS